MSDDIKEQNSTPPEELRRQIMSYSEPKNEREWWAMHRIEQLEAAYAQQQQVWSDAIKRRDVLESLFPAILEYLENQADVVDGDNGIPAPNIAMSLLVWTKHALEGK